MFPFPEDNSGTCKKWKIKKRRRRNTGEYNFKGAVYDAKQ